jgi:hypothetical protein
MTHIHTHTHTQARKHDRKNKNAAFECLAARFLRVFPSLCVCVCMDEYVYEYVCMR